MSVHDRAFVPELWYGLLDIPTFSRRSQVNKAKSDRN